MKKREEEMRKIKEDVWNLTKSPFYDDRVENNYFPVLGEGSHEPDFLFVGEAPGKNEALKGIPFCGASGRILDELLSHIGITRESVYITNIVKDRPPSNRDPSPDEIEIYAPFLDRQIEVLEPKVIVTLGRHAMNYILNRYGDGMVIPTISQAHGKEFMIRFSYGEVFVVPLYHPAVALYNVSRKDELKEDFEILRRFN